MDPRDKCLDQTTIATLTRGLAPHGNLSRLERHLIQCPRCRRRIADLVCSKRARHRASFGERTFVHTTDTGAGTALPLAFLLSVAWVGASFGWWYLGESGEKPHEPGPTYISVNHNALRTEGTSAMTRREEHFIAGMDGAAAPSADRRSKRLDDLDSRPRSRRMQ